LFPVFQKYEKELLEGPAQPVIVSAEAEALALLHKINKAVAGLHYPEGAHFTGEEMRRFDEMREESRRRALEDVLDVPEAAEEAEPTTRCGITGSMSARTILNVLIAMKGDCKCLFVL
jgi:hypothetical protein